MKPRYLRTSDIAKAVGVHPNTVRLYEVWGFLPPIPRSPSGYRLFTEAHLDQMRLARKALGGPWPGRKVKQSALALVRRAASNNLGGALEQAYIHLTLVQAERAQAEAAAAFLERWTQDTAVDTTIKPMQIRDAAKLLDLTPDVLRNWERNGLIHVLRDPHTSYRLYGAAEIGRLRVIRMLRRAGYSMMAILRMMLCLDQGQTGDLRHALDTPRPDEDICSAADRWLSTLAAQEHRAMEVIARVQEMISKRQK
jgi:DNA-binding transcriptional MerR regulator